MKRNRIFIHQNQIFKQFFSYISDDSKEKKLSKKEIPRIQIWNIIFFNFDRGAPLSFVEGIVPYIACAPEPRMLWD